MQALLNFSSLSIFFLFFFFGAAFFLFFCAPSAFSFPFFCFSEERRNTNYLNTQLDMLKARLIEL